MVRERKRGKEVEKGRGRKKEMGRELFRVLITEREEDGEGRSYMFFF